MENKVLIYSILCILLYYEVAAENGKIGPYRAVMVNASRCEKPSLPYQKSPSIAFFVEIYNTTKKSNLIRGNITIFKEKANYRIRTKSYVLEDGKWKISYMTNSAGCRGVLLQLFTTLMGLDHDKDKCTIKKGTYSFEGIDTNQFEHSWLSTKVYGTTESTVEIFEGSKTAECWRFHEIVVPLVSKQ